MHPYVSQDVRRCSEVLRASTRVGTGCVQGFSRPGCRSNPGLSAHRTSAPYFLKTCLTKSNSQSFNSWTKSNSQSPNNTRVISQHECIHFK